MEYLSIDTPLDELGLGARAVNCLRRMNILTLGDLIARKSEMQSPRLLMIQNLGKKTQDTILQNLPRLERLAGPNGIAAAVMRS